ncbi:DUF6586 family protein [Marinospirillum alkaliphilum]|uniref:Uncharacterized protein n=1 Tax=Marinospirillum alkaliphilum DSM 21637 TaxID=1122209 RepID=A0A1K1WYC9_9GAMM|nr:DUF6586 family protein [Marinospirillum alkaliphilum]SFX42382.1 hypothetical protein SAMN02745752_01600 [Marinospirillum alkaliphilum DSM 21637]
MIQAQRLRVNQKLHQARLMQQAAAQPVTDELNQLAWQQACIEAAVLALEAARLAFLRELAAIHRLDVRAVQQAADLRTLAAAREQALPELDQLEAAFNNPQHPLWQLKALLAEVNRIPAPTAAPAAGEWMPEAPATPAASPATPVKSLIPLAQLEETDASKASGPSREMQQLESIKNCLNAMQALIRQLREQLYED